MSVNFSYGPPTSEAPHQRLQPYKDTPGLPVLSFTKQVSVDVIQLSFDPRTPEHTIRYLRKLATKATELAAAVEFATSKVRWCICGCNSALRCMCAEECTEPSHRAGGAR